MSVTFTNITRNRPWLSVSITIKTTYWKIGRHIVEFEQQGGRRAKYGTALLSNLARILRARVGRGYSHPNLNNMRKFYIMYPNFQMSDKSGPIFQMSEKLTWSHICELVTIDDPLEREFYEKECISEGWTVDALHRLKESGLFMRLAMSKDKEGVIKQQIQTPELRMGWIRTYSFLSMNFSCPTKRN